MPPEDLSQPLTPQEAARLNLDILAWHETNNIDELAYGYRTGGQDALLRGDIHAACFLFTQAYVYALRAGLLDVADGLWSNLRSFGREA